MAAPDSDVARFLADLDAIVDRVRVRRRPQDAGAPECSPRELRALAALGRHGRLTMSALATLLDTPLSTATRTVDRLVGKGLVERKRAATDRRVLEVGFGRRGRHINDYVDNSRRADAAKLLRGLSASERKELVRLLGRVAAAARDGAAKA
jgi:DNA-binding MarR family transcriptional regulator